MLLEGPAGIGKSRLLEEAVVRASRDGLQVLRARGAELERELPFGVARQLVAPALAGLGDDGRDAVLRRLGAGAEAVLGGPPSKAADQAALVDALFWTTYELAHRPGAPAGTLLAVDDAQWADAASLRVLVRLAVGLEELGVALVVAVRTGEPSRGGLLDRLQAHPDARTYRPAALSDQAVAAVVRARLGGDAAPAFCRACAVASGGNPFLLSALVASLRADGVPPTAESARAVAELVPDAVLHAVRVRLSRLPGPARRLALAATVLTADAPLRHGAAVAGLRAGEAAEAAGALVDAGVLAAGDPLRFAHPLVGEAIAADVTPLGRARDHRRAAEALAADAAPAEHVAAHLRRTTASGDPWVVDVLRTAARDALARGEAPGAAQLLERALAEPPDPALRPTVVRELVGAEAAAGSPRALERLQEVPDAGHDPRERARTLQALSRLLFARGEVGAAVEAAERARDALVPDDQLAGRILASQIANMFFLPGAWPRTRRLLAELERGLDEGRWRPEPVLLAQLSTQRGVWLGEGPDRVRPIAEAMLAQTPDAGEVWQGDPSLAAALAFVGEVVLADRVLQRMEAHARRTGSPIYAGMTAQWRATLRLQQGWAADAALDAERVLAAVPLGWTAEVGWAAATLAVARLELDDLDGARAAVATGMDGDRGALPHGFVLEAAGRLALAEGRPDAALAHFLAAGTHLRERFALENPAVVPWRAGAALAHLALGDADRAREEAAVHLGAARTVRVPYATGLALRVCAAVARGREDRVAHLEEAVAILGPSGADLELAHACCDLGVALREAGRAAEARGALGRALALAERLGATAAARRAAAELRRSGERGGAATGTAVLTPAERRVAELAAQDLGNAEIAQRLFITQRTVEWHLTQTYRKLGIRSRVGIAQALESAS